MDKEDKKDYDFLRRTLELAEIAFEKGSIPIGALLVNNDEILFEGYKGYDARFQHDVTAHAEMFV